MNPESNVPGSTSRSINVNLISTEENLSFNHASRAILPDISSTSFDFYIEGFADYNPDYNIPFQKIPSASITYSTSTKGSFAFSFEPTYYRLKMYAVKSGDNPDSASVENIALLKASAAVDLRANDEINFYLSSYNLSGKGYFDLKIYADGWTCNTSEFDISFSVLNKSDGNVLVKNDYSKTSEPHSLPESPETALSFTSSGNSIDAGTHLLKITFSNAAGKSYSYSDNIVISPNQTTRGSVKIPDIIGKKPAAPTYLIAGFHDIPRSSSFDLYYPVEFCWDDTSYNESDFEIELMNISGLCAWDSDIQIKRRYNDILPYTALHAPLPKLLGAFDASGNLTATQNEMNDWWALALKAYGSDDYGLNCGVTSTSYFRSKFSETNLTNQNWTTSESCYALVYLLLGNTYIARIRAINDDGFSDWVYLDLSNKKGKSFIATTNFSVSDFTAFDGDASGISRFRIFYNLDGGAFYHYNSDSASYENANPLVLSSFQLCQTFTQLRNSSASIQNPLNVSYGASAERASLFYYSTAYSLWQHWSRDASSSTAFEDASSPGSYSGGNNLYLFAYYGNSTEGKTFSLRKTGDEPVLPENADFTVTAHKIDSAMRGPFDSDTEDLNSQNYSPLSLTEGETLQIPSSSYGYLTFLINCTKSGADNISVNIAKSGAQGVTYSDGDSANPVTEIKHQTKSFKFCQIKISDYDLNTIYYVYYTFKIEGTEYHYTLSFKLI